MSATLTITPIPEQADMVQVVVDCDHGTTSMIVAYSPKPDDVRPSDADLSRTVVARHYAAERCGCTRKLRRRLGIAPAWP